MFKKTFQTSNKNKKTYFNEECVKFLISNIILGLEYLHSKGFIHKDLKPENIFFDKDGYLKLGDLGEAKVISSTETHGSGGYMCPDIALNDTHDKSVDYFSLGVICYELLYQKRPFNE